MKIRLTERQYRRLIKEYGGNEYQHLTIEGWEDIWWDLRKITKSFWEPDRNWFGFGGLFFFLDEDEGVLELPPQKLSEWRDDPTDAREILDDYVKRLKNIFEQSDLGLKLDVDPDYSMKIYKLQLQ